MKPFFALLFVSFLFACKQKNNVLSIDKMKVVMLDMITVDEWVKINNTKDSSLIKTKQNTSLYNQVFKMHSIKKEDFYNSYSYYQTNPTELKVLMDSLSNYANRKRDTIVNGWDTLKPLPKLDTLKSKKIDTSNKKTNLNAS